MMMRPVKFILQAAAGLLLLQPLLLQGQTAAADMQQLSLSAFEKERLVLQVEYIMLMDGAEDSRMTGRIVSHGNRLRQEIGPVEVIRNEHFILNAEHTRKVILLNSFDASVMPRKTREEVLRLNVDSLQHLISSTEKTETGGIRTYRFDMKEGALDRVTVSFHLTTYLPSRIVLRYREPKQAQNGKKCKAEFIMNFVSVATPEEISPAEFSIEKYVTVSGTTATLKPPYTGYRLINNLRIQR